MKRILSLFLLFVLILSFSSCTFGGGSVNDDQEDKENDEKQEPETGYEVGNLAYSLDVLLLLEDGTVNIEDYRGKAVVINFWGTWCGPCKSELPHFNELADEYSDDVIFLLVHSTDENEDPVEYVSTNFPNSKMIFARDSKLNEQWDKYYKLLGGIGYYPRTLVLDAEGVITYTTNGALTKAALKTELDKALDK